MIQLVVPLAHDGTTAGDQPVGTGWLPPVQLYRYISTGDNHPAKGWSPAVGEQYVLLTVS